MNNLTTLLKETMIIKKLSPERAAPFIGCTSRQIRRWIEGEASPGPVHRKAIEKGISKINREIDDGFRPGKKSTGAVHVETRWGSGLKIEEDDNAFEKKMTLFFTELLQKAGSGGRSALIQLADEHFLGFEQICAVASKLKVELPKV